MIQPKTVINVKNLNLAFGSNGFKLENINDIQIKEGEIIGILGESGCGKSTFGKCLIGLINQRDKSKYNITTLSDSRIEVPYLNDIVKYRNLINASKDELRTYRKHAQMIFQNPRSSLNLNMPVPDILEEAIRINEPNISNRNLEKKIHTLTDQFEITGQKAKAKPKNLSGGERRRLEICRCLITNPRVLLLDEPMAGVDLLSIQDIKSLLLKLQSRPDPVSCIISDHNAGQLLKIVDRAVVLANGIIVANDSPRKLVNHPEARRLYFGEDFTSF